MSYRLRVAPVSSSSRLASALSPGAAADYGDVADGVLTVDDYDTAADLVDHHHNVAWADGDPGGPATCDVVKADGEVCGRPLPCRYHSS